MPAAIPTAKLKPLNLIAERVSRPTQMMEPTIAAARYSKRDSRSFTQNSVFSGGKFSYLFSGSEFAISPHAERLHLRDERS